MGFIEETGAAQHYRDASISIYEGTNGIQANDLLAEVLKDRGAAMRSYIAEIFKPESLKGNPD